MSTETHPTHREVGNRGLLVVSVMLATLMQAQRHVHTAGLQQRHQEVRTVIAIRHHHFARG